jgi:K+-transporting ATPase A subunit
MARVYTSEHDSRVERILYRMMGVDPKADQRWPVYARSLFAFSAVSVLGLFALLRLQPHLPLSLGFPGVPPDQAFNTAASFVTNTNWQSCGPVASQEAIKQLGTNGVGFYNANSAHQFESPNPFSNFLQIFFLLLIPVTRTFGADGEGQAERVRHPGNDGPCGRGS